tara:strand:+ start:385 stop:2202 length:1818 start_codon:yes stop_codon:yes gene_type:complete
MATNITSAQLDFEQIKSSLKTHFANKSEFSDYDFETSGLSNILDVLAYNTHLNGLVANFATNESFLNTAQLRSSVVSHAEGLGYRPTSSNASESTITVSIDLSAVGTRPSSISLPIGTVFTASNDSETYTFTNKSTTTASDLSGIYTFEDIVVYEGVSKTKTFLVDSLNAYQTYVIPDESIDTNSLEVRVYNTPTSSAFSTYTFLDNAIEVSATTEYYDIREAPNGHYEINFGDGKSFGKAPPVGGKILVTYDSVTGSSANGSINFAATNPLNVNGVNYTISVGSQIPSHSGAEKETIESIKLLAPIQFSAQQRLVTPLDYKGMILSRFATVTDVAVWGGEQNIPIDYGKVYISLLFASGTTDAAKDIVKNKIKTIFTDNLSVMSIDNVFVEPQISYIELTTEFYYNEGLTKKTTTSLQTLVDSYISTYFTNNLGKFSSKFRRSPLLTGIDDVDRSILSSKIDIKIQQRFSPTLGSSNSYQLNFPVSLEPFSGEKYIIESSQFTYRGNTCIFRNKLSSNKIEIFVPSNGTILETGIGSYDNLNGTLILNTFAPDTIVGGLTEIKVSAIPQNQAVISPLRNYVITLDTGASRSYGNVEFSTQKIVL